MSERAIPIPDEGRQDGPTPPQPTLVQRVERKARYRHLRLVKSTGQPLDPDDRQLTNPNGRVRPLGVAPKRWAQLAERGMREAQFDEYWQALGAEIKAELFARPPRAA